MATIYSFTPPQIEFHQLDLNDIDRTAEFVADQNPDILISTATLQTWWLADLLPEPQATQVKKAGFGIWLPVNLTLTLKLMRALENCHYRGLSLTAPFPDVSNVVLSRLGIAPTCGIGNVDEVVPKVQLMAAESLGVPVKKIEIDLIAHHAIQKYTLNRQSMATIPDRDLPPYYLRITVEGVDVTNKVDSRGILFSAFPITAGPASHFLTAGASLKLLRALCREEKSKVHTPAPNGLPGGYPVWANRSAPSP